jgi:hypothetical protein
VSSLCTGIGSKTKEDQQLFLFLFNKSTHPPGVLQASSAAADMTSHLQTELRATCTARTAWAVALRWLNLAATVCDGKPSELGHVTATSQT